MNRVLSILFLFIGLFGIAQKRMDDSNNTPTPTNAHSFIENKGQWDKDILFKSSFKGGNLWVQRKKLMFHLKDYQELRKNHGGGICDTCKNREHAVHLNFEGCNSITQFSSSTPSKEYYNYYLGNDQTKWASNVHAYTEATLHELYTGIDLKLIQSDEELKYEFHLQPKANPKQIKLSIAGATNISIDAYGQLEITTPIGNIIEKKPFVYQWINGNKNEIRSAFEVINNNVQFKLGNYDTSLPLIIDPILVFATYSGSVTDNFGMTATYGYDGTAYSGGTIFGNAYPTPDNGAYDITSNFTVQNADNLASDVFISKYSADGTTMLWTTFMGGGSDYLGAETIHSLICDKSNNVYGFGATSSVNFPVTSNAFQQTHKKGEEILIKNNGALFKGIGTDIYTCKISSDGKNLLGSTLIGGSGNDGLNYNNMGKSMQYSNRKIIINGSAYVFIPYDTLTTNYGDQFRGEIMLDSLNNVIIATSTRSTDFPLKNAFQPQLNGQQDGVIFKLKNDFSDLLFSSYLGGSENDALYSVKLDSSYNIVFCGGTSSPDIAITSNVYQSTYGGGKADGILGKLNPNGGSIKHLTYIGLDDFDQTFIVEVDEKDRVYVIGHSIGGKFPIINATYSNPNSCQFIAQLDSSLSTINKSTVYGSGNPAMTDISPSAMMVDLCRNIYISGWGANIIQNLAEYNLYWGTDPNYYYTGDIQKNIFTKQKGKFIQDMPISSDAFQKTPPNGFDFHLFSLDREFSRINYGSYMGGDKADEHVDGGTSRFDKNGVIYQSICGGCGGNSDFPTSKDAHSQLNLSNNCNNIVLKFDFQIQAIPSIQLETDSACIDKNISFKNTSSAYDFYYWSFGNGEPKDSTHLTITRKYTTPGTYPIKLTIKNSVCNIYEYAETSVTILENKIQLAPIPDFNKCQPDSALFKGSALGTAKNYVWSTNPAFSDTINKTTADSTLHYYASQSGKLYFQAYDRFCDRIDTININIYNTKLKIKADSITCINDIDTLSAFFANSYENFTFDWTPKSPNQAVHLPDSLIVTSISDQYYFLKALGNNGCVLKDSIYITVKSPTYTNLQANASEHKILKGNTVELTSTPSNLHYQWTPIESISDPNEQNTQAKPTRTTVYTVTANDGVCVSSDTTKVVVIEDWVCDFPYVFVPNAFSPNNDGENDILYVRGRPITKILFRVFNRWGEKVFESQNLNDGWDGTFKGKLLDPDVYDYYLLVECQGGLSNQQQGNVTLLR